MANLLKTIVDFFYRTNAKRNRFEDKNKVKTLAADAAKGIIIANSSEITRGSKWALSQRSIIFLTDKAVFCGKWNIPIESIDSASMVRFKSIFGGGQVLKIDTLDKKCYQFGMQVNNEWRNQKALNITFEDGKVKTPTSTIILWLIMSGISIYWLLLKFGVIFK
jgi:hypothetical protein